MWEAVPASHLADSNLVGAWKVTRGQVCLHADCPSPQVPSAQHPESLLSHRQSSSIQQSQPDFPDMSGLCTLQQRKVHSKTQYLPRFPGQWTATWPQLVHSCSRQFPPPPLPSSVLRTKGPGVSRLVAKATFPRLFYCRPCI